MMKRGLILLLAIALMSSFVSAANSYTLNDFSDEPTQGIVVGENDEVRFDLLGGTHTIIFDRVKDVGFRFTGYAFLDDTKQMTGFATSKYSSYIDVDRDGVNDMTIAFYKSKFDEEKNETYATVIFKVDDHILTGAVTGSPTESEVIVERNYSKYLGIIGAAVFILVLIAVAIKTNKKKSPEHKEESE